MAGFFFQSYLVLFFVGTSDGRTILCFWNKSFRFKFLCFFQLSPVQNKGVESGPSISINQRSERKCIYIYIYVYI